MRLSTYYLHDQSRADIEKYVDEYNEYQREQYQKNKEDRTAKMRQRRAERSRWLERELFSDDRRCIECNFPTGAATRWHYRDLMRDSADTQRNLSHLRFMARQGCAYKTLEAEIAQMMPLCVGCLAKLRPVFVPAPMLTSRQEYDRARYPKTKGKRKDYMQARRIERKEWIAARMDRPCDLCRATEDIVWHKRNAGEDYEDQQDNTRTLRYLANAGASYDLLEKEMETLFPICKSCYQSWRRINGLAE